MIEKENVIGYTKNNREININEDKKLKVYLDTSVISYLQQEDSPEKMKDTLSFWNKVINNEFEVYISQITLNEVEQCYEPKRSALYEYLSGIEYKVIKISEEIITLAESIIEKGILKRKSFDDCQHISAAITSGCDCIVSWNFKHIVNIKTIKGVREVTNIGGYKGVEIITPTILLESEG